MVQIMVFHVIELSAHGIYLARVVQSACNYEKLGLDIVWTKMLTFRAWLMLGLRINQSSSYMRYRNDSELQIMVFHVIELSVHGFSFFCMQIRLQLHYLPNKTLFHFSIKAIVTTYLLLLLI